MAFLKSIVGSFSTGADANPTVALMDAAFQDLSIPWTYLNCEVDPNGLQGAVAGAVSMRWRGFNCSMPHKQSVIPLIDRLSETAALTNAVNCVVFEDNELVGHNTDGSGFLHSISEVLDVAGCDAVIIGSGGAAHAIAVELARAGVNKVTIASRNLTSSASLAGLISSHTTARAHTVGLDRPVDIGDTDLVVNATPLGSAVHPADPGQSAVFAGTAVDLIDWDSSKPHVTVADVTINPPRTSLLRTAEDAGHTTVDGTGMLVNQAIENIRLWTHEYANRRPMRRALEMALGL